MSQCEGTMSFGGYPLEIALVFNEKGLQSLSALDSCLFVPEVNLDPAERALFVRNLLLPILNAKPHHETNRVFARGIICHLKHHRHRFLCLNDSYYPKNCLFSHVNRPFCFYCSAVLLKLY